MKSVLVFSGTVEGRKLVEKLVSEGIYCHVYVATAYGELVMDSSSLVTVHVGRLTMEEMASEIRDKKPEAVYDATHPYAKEVSKNILDACNEAGVGEIYNRINREIIPAMKKAMECGIPEAFFDNITVVTSVKEAALFLVNQLSDLKDEDKILVATGVKNLGEYVSSHGLKSHLVVRVIPSVESLSSCLEMGINPGNILAMKGPFSTKMNEVIIEEYGIKYLVTKNSGSRGGFEEKLRAAWKQNIKIVIVEELSNIS